MLARLVAAIAAMVVVVTASNILVLYPVQVELGPLHLGDLLTWGAFTYPFAFLVTDLTNRYDGARKARVVVMVGFVAALALSFWLASLHGRPSSTGDDAAHRHRVGDGVPHRAVARHLGVLAAARPLGVVGAAARRVAGRLAARYGDLLHASPSRRRWSSSISLFGLRGWFARLPAPWLGARRRRCRCGCRSRAAISLVKFLAALLLLAPYRALDGQAMPLPP